MKRASSHHTLGILAGFILGLGAPVGGLLFKILLRPAGSMGFGGQIAAELTGHTYFYGYMALTTPVVFMTFGGYLGHLIDAVHEQKNKVQELAAILKKQSVTDELTGIHNRRHLFEEIEREASRSARFGRPLAGIMIDIDNFKSVNDQHGHPMGDRVLRRTAEILRDSVRVIDIVGRYGGDEFVVVLPESGSAGAKVVADRVLRTIRGSQPLAGPGSPPVTVSLGIVAFDTADQVSASRFIEAVDRALREAKTLGKDQVFTSN